MTLKVRLSTAYVQDRLLGTVVVVRDSPTSAFCTISSCCIPYSCRSCCSCCNPFSCCSCCTHTSCCPTHLEVFGPRGELLFTIATPSLAYSSHDHFKFTIAVPEGREVGSITRSCPGLTRHLFTDTDR